MISICINTKNRTTALKKTIFSIKNSDYLKAYEIIIIDQSNQDNLEINHKSCQKFTNVKHIIHNESGTGKAKNLGIKLAKGNIIAFTDDDCIVTNNWLKNIEQAFNKNKTIAAVFGQSLPYQAQQHQQQTCVCTLSNRKKETIITQPCFHAEQIGFGNNMAFRTKVLKQVDGFKPWLGPGSIGENAEDAEIALRLLTTKHQILYSPKIKIHHNKWLTKKQFYQAQLSYICGEFACYGFYAFQGYHFAQEILKQSLKNYLKESFVDFKNLLKLEKDSGYFLGKQLQKIFSIIKGLWIALYYSYKEHLNNKLIAK